MGAGAARPPGPVCAAAAARSGDKWQQPDLPPKLEWPLRILIVIGCEPGDTSVNAEEEVRAILRALDPVDAHVDVLIKRQPGRAQLQTLLSATAGPCPHIFHYIGHGGVPQVVPGDAPGVPGSASTTARRLTARQARRKIGLQPRFSIFSTPVIGPIWSSSTRVAAPALPTRPGLHRGLAH